MRTTLSLHTPTRRFKNGFNGHPRPAGIYIVQSLGPTVSGGYGIGSWETKIILEVAPRRSEPPTLLMLYHEVLQSAGGARP